MTKQIVIIVFSLLSAFAFGQNKEVGNLIGQVYQQVVPSNFNYYNLVDSSFVTKFDKYSLDKNELKDLLKSNPDFPYDNFVLKCKDSGLISWAVYDLEKAKIYSYTSIPKFASQIRINRIVPYKTSQQSLDSLEKLKKYNEVIVPAKSTWSDKRRSKEIEKAWVKYSDSKRPEDKVYFRFSTPIFSDNGLYVIITLNQSDRGATYIFKKIGDKWVEIFLFRRWIS